MKRRTRVKRTGDFARWFAYPIPLAFISVESYRLVFGSDEFPDGTSLTPETAPLWLACWAVSISFLWRGARLGVWVGDDTVVARSWFLSWTIARSDIVVCRSVPYTGFITRSLDSHVLQMISFQVTDAYRAGRSEKLVRWMSDFDSIDVRGTVAPAPVARKQAAALTEALGLSKPASEPRHRG